MEHGTDVVLLLGSGPNAPEAAQWSRAHFDRLVAINNAWRVRDDWDDLVFPEDFPAERHPPQVTPTQKLVEADAFVPAQNAYGGFIYAGGTMAFTAAYWVLHALKPKVIAFMGCDMVYPRKGPTHFYGTGTADPLRADITLQDLGAKSARLGLIAAQQGCACVNLSAGDSTLLFARASVAQARYQSPLTLDHNSVQQVLNAESALGYKVASGRYWEQEEDFDPKALAEIDAQWRAAWAKTAAHTDAA